MTTSLKLAVIVFNGSLIIALFSGLGLIWLEPGDITPGFPWRILGVLRNVRDSSVVLMLVTGLYLVICAVLARIQRNSKHASTSPTDE